MFVLEESQLLEDTIDDRTVLQLYKKLRELEATSERVPIIEHILCHDKSLTLTEHLLDTYQSNNFKISQAATEECRFSVEQRAKIFGAVSLEPNDVAALALTIAASLTNLFVIDNFTGPSSDTIIKESYRNLPESLKSLSKDVEFRSLSADGSDVHHRTINPWILRLVQLYWNFIARMGCSRKILELEFLVWKHRYLTTHLASLLEPAESLINELRKVQEFIFDHYIINEARENKTQLVRFNTVELCCELIQSALLRDGYTSCRKFFDYAFEVSGIAIKHTGVLGKRTRFQQKNIPQLLIQVTKRQEQLASINSNQLPEDPSSLPIDVKLEDDTLLPDISFVKEDEDGKSTQTEQDLSIEAQLLMLSRLDFILKTEVMEESLKDEWLLAYLRSIINSAGVWALRFKALSVRSTVEKKHMRKTDRALLQLEELIKLSDYSAGFDNRRMRSFYSIFPSGRLQLQRSLADISFDLGLVKSALEIYKSIEFWEGVIKCHCTLGEAVKAQELIRQELLKNETPYLYCLLGDATEDLSYYEKAWELSKGRFARAKKSIGTYYYVRKDYEKAIQVYEQALTASPSNTSILALLAYSCLTIEKYERAAECYRNLTYQDDTNFLAWNNLSKAYIKLNQKERAWRTLREAIKCNFEEWRVWENFMLVSIEVGSLDDVITAWHRIIDIRSSHKDDQILSALTYEVIRQSYIESGSNMLKLLTDSLKLIARLTTTSACSPRVWVCYFRLLVREYELFKLQNEANTITKFDIDSRVSKIVKTLQRATPTAIATDPDWFNSKDKICRMLDDYDELVDCYSLTLDVIGPRSEIWSQWKNSKLSIVNVKKTLELKGLLET